jgi:hypothetical protein
MVECGINLIEDGSHMHFNCRISWDYGIKNVCHPSNYFGWVGIDTIG